MSKLELELDFLSNCWSLFYLCLELGPKPNFLKYVFEKKVTKTKVNQRLTSDCPLVPVQVNKN